MRNNNQFYNGEQYQFRLGVYLSNKRIIESHNAATFKIGLNKLACLTPSEYKALLGRKTPNFKRTAIVKDLKSVKAPESVDWREKGIVNPVKDQSACGSCWAFGTVQACESAYALATGKLLSCSEQNLVDCVTSCAGCSGGMESYALDYILESQDGWLMGEDDYPYEAVEGSCRFDKSKGIVQIKSYAHGKEGDEDYLKTLSSQGVCDVAINAGSYSFQLYTSGIYDEPSCSSYLLNHAVGLVGYGTENGVDYWIVRNSWGPAWGEAGYIRMSRNKDNQCGIASDALQVYA
ncbi:Clan CA, family C1, cathepsin L-like cysteine peptidase [Tritrichomonas foetus]|uniref:Clan CA, family C1, cathepsin L-like cysteine peptidase n=1 Tax=Tritrichomonas foetus TaxID=1144522 RepID=A0A1J4JER0_9EUKA|nr:Clan CA, family C1, cathepsin L-like cysteine peptidase [Tritrichomonas foetus]|eukprot:OHS97642.1 Clan CA, family C1, cathepsin L-like cysteine peptidase [Tritrichomonas foetus]